MKYRKERKFQRITAEKKAIIQGKNSKNQLLDLSFGGARILSNANLNLNDDISFSFQTPNKKISLNGKILRKTPFFSSELKDLIPEKVFVKVLDDELQFYGKLDKYSKFELKKKIKSKILKVDCAGVFLVDLDGCFNFFNYLKKNNCNNNTKLFNVSMEFFKHYLASQELQNTFKIKTFQNQNPSTLFLKNLPDPNTYFCNLYDPMFGFKKTEKLPISESINFYILENCILLNIIPVRQLTVDRDGIIKFINISANKSKNFIVDQAFSSFFASIENEINLSFKRILNTKIPEKINNTKLFFEGKLTRFMLTIFPIINEYEYILGFNIYMEETQQNAPLDGFANFDISVKRHQKSLFKCNSCERHFGIFKTKDLYCPFCQKNGILVNNSFFDFGIQFNELDSKSSSDLYEYLTDELIKLGLTHRDFERFIPKNLNFNLGTFKEGQNLQIIDFSQGGLKLKAAFDLKIGEVINFKLENKGETISIFLKILRKNNLVKEKSTIYAAKFLNYSQDDFKQINLFFDQLVDKNKQYNLNQKSSKLRNKFLMGSIISMVFLVGFSFFFIQEKIKDFVKFEYRKLKTIYYQKHHKTKINLDNLFQLAEVETSFVKTKVNKEKIKSPIKKEVNIWTLNAQEILDLENKKFDDFLNSFDSLNNYNLSVPWQRELHYLQFKYSKNKLTKLYFEIHFFIKNSDQEIQNKYKEKSQTVLGKISGKLKQIENIIIEHSSLIDSLKDQAFANYLGQIWRVTRENILK